MNFRYEDINFPSKQTIVECIVSANAFMSLVFAVVFIIDFEKVQPADITCEMGFIEIWFCSNIITLVIDKYCH